jgi:hypothetical protein
MNENTALTLMVLTAFLWNVFIWLAFLYMVIHLGTSMWVLLIPACLTVFPKSRKKDE